MGDAPRFPQRPEKVAGMGESAKAGAAGVLVMPPSFRRDPDPAP